MRRIAASVVLLALGACATPDYWVRHNATQQEFDTDSYACERDVRQSGYYGTGYVGASNAKSFMRRCMGAKGWTRQSQPPQR